MATSKKPEKEPDKVPDKEAIKEEAKDFQHGLDVSPSMPYYCTWLPGACPEGDEGVGDSPFTRPPLCPPPGAGPATIVPTFVPPCPTMPMVCVPTFNPQCPKQDAVKGHANAIAQTRTIITCTGIPIVCGQHEQAQTLLPTTTVYTYPVCPTVNPVATCIPNTTDCPEGQVAGGVSAPPNCPTVQQCPPTWNCGAQAQTLTATTTVQTANTHCFICPPATVAQAQTGGIGQSAIILNCRTQHGPATVCVVEPVNTLYSAPPNCPTVQVCVTQPQAAGTIGQSAIILNCPTQHGTATVCGTGPVNTLYSAPPNCPTAQQCPPTWNCGTQPQAQITLLSSPAVCPTIHTHCYVCPPGETAQAQAAGTIGQSAIIINCPTQHGPATVCGTGPVNTLYSAPPACTGIQTNACTIGITGWHGCFPSGTATTTVNPCGTGTKPQITLLTAPPACGGIQTNVCPPGTIGVTGWHGCFPSGTATTTVNPCGTGTKPQITLLTAPPACGGIQTNVCPPGTIGVTGWQGCFPSGTATTTVNPCGTGTKPQITLLTAPPACGGIQTNVCPPGTIGVTGWQGCGGIQTNVCPPGTIGVTGWQGCFPSGTATTTVNPCGTGTKPQITLLTAPPACGGIQTNVCPPGTIGVTGWQGCFPSGTATTTVNPCGTGTKPQITLLTAPPACGGIQTNVCPPGTIGVTGWQGCFPSGTATTTVNPCGTGTKPQITLLTAPPACGGIQTNVCPPGTIGVTGWQGCFPSGTATTTVNPCGTGTKPQITLLTAPPACGGIQTNVCPPGTIGVTGWQGCGGTATTTVHTQPQITLLTAPPACTGIQTTVDTIGYTGWYTCTQAGTGPQPQAVTLATVCTQGGTVHDTLFTQPFGQCPIGTDATICTQYGCPQPTITNPVATCPITTVQGGAQAQTAIRTIPAICNMTGPGQCPPSFGCPGGIGAQAQAAPHPTTTTTFPPICGGVTRNATVCTIATTCTQVAACPGGANVQAKVPHCYTVANCGNTYATVCTMSPQCTKHPAIPDGNQGAQAQAVSALRPSICCTHAHEVCITAAPKAQWTLPNTTCGIGPVTTTNPGTVGQAQAQWTVPNTTCGIGPVTTTNPGTTPQVANVNITVANVCTQIGCPQITLVTYSGCNKGITRPQAQAQVQHSMIPALCGIVPYSFTPPCITTGPLPITTSPGCPVPTTFTQLGCRTVGVVCPNTAPASYAGCTA